MRRAQMNREDVERKVKVAEASLQDANARLETAVQRLEELEREREQTLGESEIARRAVADFERLCEGLRNDLALLELEEAVQVRDRVIAEAAAALDASTRLLEEIGARRAAVAEADERVRALDPSKRRVPEEPDILREPWLRMVSAVKAQLDEELEADLVDAAARSNKPRAINELPEHLRALATQRRRTLQREAMERLNAGRPGPDVPVSSDA